MNKIKDFLYDVSDLFLSLLIIGIIFFVVSWKLTDTMAMSWFSNINDSSIENLEFEEGISYTDDDVMTVCFLTTHDITGGNSGSPVINDKGELIGLAFDGNWEAMSGDIAFEPELQRTINVDIRYVMFIIDKFAGATNLIDEMTIVQ